MKCRIVERQYPGGTKEYVIQQKIWLFGWCDAWRHSWRSASCPNSFYTLEEAQNHLCYFDGTQPTDRVVVGPKEGRICVIYTPPCNELLSPPPTERESNEKP